MFSNHIIEAIEGDAARECFNRSLKEKIYESYKDRDKNKLYAFYQDECDVYEIELNEDLEASYFDLEWDIYIYDPENRWTYINTHERDWFGPYYYGL